MEKSIDFDKYAPLYEECKNKGTLPWDNFDTFCEVVDALEKAGLMYEKEKTTQCSELDEYKERLLAICEALRKKDHLLKFETSRHNESIHFTISFHI